MNQKLQKLAERYGLNEVDIVFSDNKKAFKALHLLEKHGIQPWLYPTQPTQLRLAEKHIDEAAVILHEHMNGYCSAKGEKIKFTDYTKNSRNIQKLVERVNGARGFKEQLPMQSQKDKEEEEENRQEQVEPNQYKVGDPVKLADQHGKVKAVKYDKKFDLVRLDVELASGELVKDIDANKVTVGPMKEGRVYIPDPSHAPKGAQVSRGPHGGYFYDKGANEPAKPAQTAKPTQGELRPVKVGQKVHITTAPGNPQAFRIVDQETGKQLGVLDAKDPTDAASKLSKRGFRAEVPEGESFSAKEAMSKLKCKYGG